MAKRYACTAGDKRGEFGDCMRRSDDGGWVRYSTYANEVKRLNRELDQLRNGSRKYKDGGDAMADALGGF